ncbi:aromatic amino acid transport family protein [Piscirickettsia litoralis]|uniref:aromatic amino acid transport family protein n=1 Tax=Piscirickettsia litoralis TaxID=1891921 RepID=UPI0013019258|nr:aromatic amino acid transport family protein [Piscirickettsia litoralis]
MKSYKFIGCVLLYAGTALGGGMLALPLATAAVGYPYSTFFIFSLLGHHDLHSITYS